MCICLKASFEACLGPATQRDPFPRAVKELAGSGSTIMWKMLQGLSVPGGKRCWGSKAVSLLPSLLCYARGEEEEREQSCHAAAAGTSPCWGS